MSRGKPVWNVVGLLLLGLLLTTLVELIDRQRQVSLQRQQIVSELARLVSELERQLAVLMPLGEPLARRLSSEPQLSSAQLQDSVEPLLAGLRGWSTSPCPAGCASTAPIRCAATRPCWAWTTPCARR